MSFLKDNKFFIFLIYINFLFILTVVKTCYKIENFNFIYVTILYIISVLFYWFHNSALKNKKLRIIFNLVLFAGIGVYCFLNFSHIMQIIQAEIIDNFNYINGLVAKSAPTDFENFKPIFIMTLPLLAIVIIFLTVKGFSNSVLILNLVLITTLWYLGYTEEIKKYLFYYVLITLTTYCINNFISSMKKLSKKGVKVGISIYKIIMYTIVISLIIAGTSSILPQEYSGKYSRTIQGKFYNKFVNPDANGEEKGKKFKYDLTFSGYSSSKKKLGGPITLNKLTVLKVESDKAYYLKGNAKDLYDGFSWNQSEKKYKLKGKKQDSMLDDKSYIHYIDTSQSIKIYPLELNSSTIFAPNLAYNAEIQKDYIYYDDVPTFISGGVISSPYTVYFYNLNSRGNQLLSGLNKLNVNEVSNIYYSENYKKYLQIPDNISQRTYDLVQSLTKDKKNNFEKVQAIKDYLRKTYPYTLKVSAIPEGQEFLDYFLFTEKKGYCTYFATAQTIMCRIAGIPARYVEGFNMSEEKDDKGLYVVRNENAHAWAEVLYMENQHEGLWYTVDAVPNAVELVHKEEEESKANIEPSPGADSQIDVNPIKKPTDRNKEDMGGDTYSKTIPLALLKAIYIASAVIFINILIILIFNVKRNSMLRKKSIIPLYKYSLNRLETVGYKNSEFISDMELINKMGEDLSERVKEAAKLAYREYYGEKEPGRFNKVEYYKFIEGYVKDRQSKIEYILKKYYFISKISLLKKKIVLLYKLIKSI